jgi:hypothetical protein
MSTLALISQMGAPAAIPDIVLLLLDRERDVSRSAAEAVSRLTKLLSPTELPWLDLVMRERSPYRWSYPSAWAELKPDRLGLLQRFGRESVCALGMASLHFSGYVRDEALRKLTDAQDGTELPFLLLRLNDWVQEVRHTAHLLVRERLTIKYAPFFVSNIVLVSRLRLVRRGHQAEIVGAIECLLKSKDCQEAVETGLRSTDGHVKRACYELAFESASFDQVLLIERALSEKDPAVRLRAAERISVLPHAESVDHLLPRTMWGAKTDDQSGPSFGRRPGRESSAHASLPRGCVEQIQQGITGLENKKSAENLLFLSDELRGGIDASLYKDYVLVLLFIILPKQWYHL